MTLAQAIPVVIGVLMIFSVSFASLRMHRNRTKREGDPGANASSDGSSDSTGADCGSDGGGSD